LWDELPENYNTFGQLKGKITHLKFYLLLEMAAKLDVPPRMYILYKKNRLDT